MVKCELLLVILVIGYLDAKSNVTKLTDDDIFVIDEVLPPEEQLLPINVEDDYQNDENLDPDEGSGFAEDVKIQDTDKVSSSVGKDDISKEKDESIPEENEHMEEEESVGRQDEEEIVNVPQVSEEENLSIKSEETDNEQAESTAEENQSINSEDDELKNESVAEEDDELNDSSIKSKETNNTKTNEENQSIAEEENESKDQIEEHTLNNEESSEKQLPIANSAETNEDTENQSQLSAVDVRPDAIEDSTTNEDNNDRINTTDTQNKPPHIGELEPIVEIIPQETDTDKTVHKEDHTSKIVAQVSFPYEKDLPAERFGNVRGLGKSMPMQDAAVQPPIDNEVTMSEMPRVDEQEIYDRGNNEHSNGDDGDVPDNNNEKIIKGTLGESDKELPNTGASEASSNSNTVTFVIILGLVAIVGCVGYFVHRRRKGHQRATPVPTYEDRELKEVKTHRLDDDGVNGGSAQKSVCHIPEANPLILTNHHLLKGTEFDKNGHLPTMQQQQQLTTFLSPQKEDDIRMMDDDVEDEVGAERRPLYTATTAEQVDSTVQQRTEVCDDKLRERED